MTKTLEEATERVRAFVARDFDKLHNYDQEKYQQDLLIIRDAYLAEHPAAPNEPGEEDTRGPAVIVDGSVLGGFEFVGPFPTISDAVRWHRTKSLPGICGLPSTVVLLKDPEREKVTTGDA